jgi:hypothetical protein
VRHFVKKLHCVAELLDGDPDAVQALGDIDGAGTINRRAHVAGSPRKSGFERQTPRSARSNVGPLDVSADLVQPLDLAIQTLAEVTVDDAASRLRAHRAKVGARDVTRRRSVARCARCAPLGEQRRQDVQLA